MEERMLSAVLTAPHHVELRERPRVPLAGAQARVRILYAGICGTDLAIWRGTYAANLPCVLGHEWVGEVVEVAHRGDEDWLGRRVVGEITNHCGALGLEPVCAPCAAGMTDHCRARSVTGIANHDGAFQEELVVPIGVLHRVPDSLPSRISILIEPLAAAIQTFELTPVKSGDRVVVLGAGRLGLLVAAVAASRGCAVTAVTRSGRNERFLDRLGIDHFRADIADRVQPIDPLAAPDSALVDTVMEKTDGLGADVVIEVTGSVHGLSAASDLVRPRGTLCIKSTPGQPLSSLNTTKLVVNEVRIQGSRCGSFPSAIAHLERHPLLAGFIEHEFALSAISDALKAAAKGGKTIIKVS
jgi:threonine dehydrogenase-like Zn-dependent dehydrogenase